MTLPKEAEVLGANSGELEIKASGAHTVVKLSAEGRRKLTNLANRVYLGLENVRGDFDAAVLTAFVNLPEDASPRDHPNLRAEAVGLYGLRRASMQTSGGRSSSDAANNDAPGLTFLLDITQILAQQSAAKLLNAEAIPIRIVPDHPLPDSIKLAIGRVSIFTTSPN